ncbi:hypothetical protein OEZ86_001926 [Tetradesmus obliquus]|nr:hypothetical protein OEZ86_001926 [Tetradesmus obliquus]
MRGSSVGALEVLAAAASKQKKKGTRARAGVDKQPCCQGKKKPSSWQLAGCEEEGDTSASDDHIVLALSGQEMVEESRKRKAAQQQCGLEHPAAVLSGVPASRQDAFAAFATQYKDALRFVDAEEAEAVYSMVALTQARGPAWPQQQPATVAAAAEAPEARAAKRFFPPGGMMGPPGCPMPPFLPPWALPPGMMPMMFGGMGMFGALGPVPPNSPPLMPLAPNGMGLPGMPLMPPAFMPGLHMVGGQMQPAGAASHEPAAGIPVNGMMHGGKAAAAQPPQQQRPASGSQQGQAQQVKQAAGTPSAAGAAKSCPAAGGSSSKPAAGSTSPASPSTAAAGPASPTQQQQQQAELQAQLEQLDVAALKPWVLSHFCEDVYLLLLDVWRPGSAKAGDAIWAWKLHVRQPRQGGGPPDLRAFLVSLFGLEKLLQLTAAERARAGAAGSPAAAAATALPAPAPVLARQGTAGGSGNSSAAEGATVMATAGSTAGALATAGSAAGGGLVVPGAVLGAAAASSAVAGMAVQAQPA